MKEFYESSHSYKAFLSQVRQNLGSESAARISDSRKEPLQTQSHYQLSEEAVSFQKKHAAGIIQQAWLNAQIMKELAHDAYIPMVPISDVDHYLLASIMFGRSQAAWPKRYPEFRVDNPFIHEKAFYHRDDDLDGSFVLTTLLQQFNIDEATIQDKTFIPAHLSENASIDYICKQHLYGKKYQLIKNDDQTIALLCIPTKNLVNAAAVKEKIRACGLVASPWEIAANIKKESLLGDNDPPSNDNRLKAASAKLCQSKEELLQSKMSGTHAAQIAMKLAYGMQTDSHSKPKVKVCEPCYYELKSVIPSDTTSDADADIFVISAGSILGVYGISSGLDLNRFIKSHFIDANRIKPATIVVDTTSALYEDLKLDPEAQKLVDEGTLSIIVHESHQKFGLLHSDQAQCGRVRCLCSKKNYSDDLIKELRENAQTDFNHHVDLRIGAFISSQCGELLEEIKKQHFTNGKVYRQTLPDHSIDKSLIHNPDDLQDPDKCYLFISDDLDFNGTARVFIPTRDKKIIQLSKKCPFIFPLFFPTCDHLNGVQLVPCLFFLSVFLFLSFQI